MGRKVISAHGPRDTRLRLWVPSALKAAIEARHGERGAGDALNALLEREYAEELAVIAATPE